MSEGRFVSRAAGWALLGRAALLLGSFGTQVLLVRVLTPSAFGAYALTLSILMVAGVVLQFGIGPSGLRAVGATLGRVGRTEARREAQRVVRTALLAATAAAAVGVVAVPVLHLVFINAQLKSHAILFGLLLAGILLQTVFAEILRGLKRIRQAALLNGASTYVLAALGSAWLYFFGIRTDDPGTGLRIVFAGLLVTLCLSSATLWNEIKTARPEGNSPRLMKPEPGVWASTAVGAFITQLDMWVVGALASPADVALYAVAFRVCMLIDMPLMITNFAVPSLVLDHLAEKRLRPLERRLRTLAGIVTIPAVFAAAAALLFGRPFLTVAFGAFYGDAATILAILAVGRVFSAWCGSCGITLLMSGGQRVQAVILFISGLLTLVFQILFFMMWGLVGVALATASGFALQNVAMTIAVRTRIGVLTSASVRDTAAFLWAAARHRQQPA
jgi:O-antigen/teichoic acid export membrane protein